MNVREKTESVAWSIQMPTNASPSNQRRKTYKTKQKPYACRINKPSLTNNFAVDLIWFLNETMKAFCLQDYANDFNYEVPKCCQKVVERLAADSFRKEMP